VAQAAVAILWAMIAALKRCATPKPDALFRIQLKLTAAHWLILS
jgi:hypothetical protein